MSRIVNTTTMTVDAVTDVGDWFVSGGAHDRAAREQFEGTAGMLLGRPTYEGLAAYWSQQEGEWADLLNPLPKFVASRTLQGPLEWNANLIEGDAAEGVSRLKDELDGDLFLIGSGELARHLLAAGLVDELRFWLHPAVWGDGTRPYQGEQVRMRLLESTSFESGVTLLRYEARSGRLQPRGRHEPDGRKVGTVAGEYTIAGGLADAQRLARQAHVMAGATDAFLSRVGLVSGWACLDVGCGGGQVTLAMARIAGPSGRVVGLDVDAEALELAREAANRAGVSAKFVQGDAVQPIAGEAFDLAYARLLLSHLVDPAATVRAMVAGVRPGGAVAVEDIFTGTLRSDPPAPALDRLQEVYSATVRFHGGDPTIGPRLRALLSASGLEDLREDTVTNPMEKVEDKLFLAQLVRNMRTSILAAEAATNEQIDELEASVEQAARDPATVFYQARIHQVSGRRPASPRYR